jgi:hypothetical protein
MFGIASRGRTSTGGAERAGALVAPACTVSELSSGKRNALPIMVVSSIGAVQPETSPRGRITPVSVPGAEVKLGSGSSAYPVTPRHAVRSL